MLALDLWIDGSASKAIKELEKALKGASKYISYGWPKAFQKVAKAVGRHHSNLSGVTVGALGLTFKAGTDDLRESPAMAIIEDLRAAGAHVRAFDPTTCGGLSPHQTERLAGIELCADIHDVGVVGDVVQT